MGRHGANLKGPAGQVIGHLSIVCAGARQRDVGCSHVALDRFSNTHRDLTVFLNAWSQIEKKLT